MNNSVKISNHAKHPCFNNCQKEVMNYEIIISFFTTVLLRIQVFWDVMLCCWVNGSTVSQECSAMQQHGVKSQKT